MLNTAAVQNYLLDLQTRIIAMLLSKDLVAENHVDTWERVEGGGGKTQVIRSEQGIESAAANYSHVFGKVLPLSATAGRPEIMGKSFEALGVSCIIHPKNPYVPTTHANVRLFIADPHSEKPVWWFGGGFDLTPYYGFVEDCQAWHAAAQAACDPFGKEVYSEFKRWADNYFYLPHRQEARGIGGIFYDDLSRWDFDTSFAFMRSVGDHFVSAYAAILDRRLSMSYGERERAFQCYRRGRYVEFNLLHDRGTLFGLQSGGRTESILASLPPVVHWQYQWQAEPNSVEATFKQDFLQPRDWI